MSTNVVLVAFVLILLTTALLLIVQRQHGLPFVDSGSSSSTTNREATFIFAGPCNSGKTTLFNLLTTGDVQKTVMSQAVGSVDVVLPFSSPKYPHKLMDFPGHIKLRPLLMDTLRNSTNIKGLVFVVDSSADPKKLGEAAEMLYDILTVTERTPNGVDILIACNKSESFASRPALKVREFLEKEISKIRERRANNLTNVKAEDEDELDIGTGSFKFDTLEGNVDAISGSSLKKKFEEWECWIEERAIN